MENNKDYIHLIRNNFLAFCCYIVPNFQTPPHVVEICNLLNKVANREITRLIISLPPRMGKSFLSSILFPAFLLGKNNNEKIIASTYGFTLSKTFSKELLDIVTSEKYQMIFPETKFSNSGKSSDIWYTEKGSAFYKSTSRGSAITGISASVLIADDLLKNHLESTSISLMKTIENWWFSTFFSRLTYRSDGAKPCCVLLMTRWSSKDIIAKILKSDNSHEWEYLNIPALDENDNALWPEMQPKELLLNIRENSPSIFQALYMGAPGEDVAAEFNISNFLIYPISHEFHKSPKFYFSSWDTAAKIGEDNDYTVGTLFSFYQNKIYLEDYVRGKYEFPELERLIIEKNKDWNARYCLVEDASSGTGILQSLKASQREIKYIGISANVKKKLPVVIPRLEDHSVVLKNYGEIISELTDYPSGEHDDCVSSIVNAVWYYSLNWRRETEISLPPKTVIKERKIRKVI